MVCDPLDGLAPARLEPGRVEQGQAIGVGQHASELRSQRTGGVPQVNLGGERLLAVPRRLDLSSPSVRKCQPMAIRSNTRKKAPRNPG